jgi:hypothetical protein
MVNDKPILVVFPPFSKPFSSRNARQDRSPASTDSKKQFAPGTSRAKLMVDSSTHLYQNLLRFKFHCINFGCARGFLEVPNLSHNTLERQENTMPDHQKIGRREAIKELATGVSGVVTGLPILNNVVQAQGHQHHVAAALTKEAAALPQAPTFFNKEQYALITELASLIIPTDETPGANEAKVNEYIDMIVGESDADTKKLYVDGLAWLDKTSRDRHQSKFLDLSAERRIGILTEISQIKETTSENQLQAKLFKAIKNITIDGFYTSKVGIEELGYIGNTVLDEFPGCTHPEHQS